MAAPAMEFQIKRATRRAVKLKGYIAGPSGGGKTLGALRLMFNFLGYDARVCVIDTENESASYYVGDRRHGPPLAFDTIKLEPPYTSARCIAALRAVVDAGFDGCIFDTISHQWSGLGGILPRKEAWEAEQKARGNRADSFQAWAKFTPEYDEFKAAMLQAPIHLLVTVRAKQEYVLEDKGNGQRGSKVTKVGMKPEQREGLEYEFGFGLMLQMDNRASRLKDRTGLLVGGDELVNLADPAFGQALRRWADEGGVEVDDGKPAAAPDPAGGDRPAARAAAQAEIAQGTADIREATKPANASTGTCQLCQEENRELVGDLCEACRTSVAAEKALVDAKALPLAGKATSWGYKGIAYGTKPIGDCPTSVLKQALHFFEGLEETDPKPWLKPQIDAIKLVLADREANSGQGALEFPATVEEPAGAAAPPIDTRLAPGKIEEALDPPMGGAAPTPAAAAENPAPAPEGASATDPGVATNGGAGSPTRNSKDTSTTTPTEPLAEQPPPSLTKLSRDIGNLLKDKKLTQDERLQYRAKLEAATTLEQLQALNAELTKYLDQPF